MLEAMLRKELFGFVFIVLLGSALHFTYEASGRFWVVGVFSAMDESIWEHLKLAFWPGLLWTGFLYAQDGARIENFWAARFFALALPPLLITIGFYAYTGILGSHALILDVGLFVISIALGQLCAVLIYRTARIWWELQTVFAVLIALLTLLFSFASFFPPDLPVFVDYSAH